MFIPQDVRKGLSLLFSLPVLSVPLPYFERMRACLDAPGVIFAPDAAVFLAVITAGNYTDAMLEPYWQENCLEDGGEHPLSFSSWRRGFPTQKLMLDFCRQVMAEARRYPLPEDSPFHGMSDKSGKSTIAVQIISLCEHFADRDIFERIFECFPPYVDFHISLPQPMYEGRF